MKNRKHARYAPSSLYRAASCPGSVRACENAPEIETDYARDGTEAHALFSFALNERYRNAEEAQIFYTGSWHYRTDNAKSRFESVQIALDYVYDILDEHPDAIMLVEQRVHHPSQIVPDDCWGTADVLIYIPSLRKLFVIDFKHGAGVAVSVKNNLQMQTYASGAINNFVQADTVEYVIIQPRNFNEDGVIRSETKTREQIEFLFRMELDMIILACEEPDAPLVPGIKQCQFCPVKVTCPAREAAALSVVHETFASVRDITAANLPPPSTMPLDKLSYILTAQPLLLNWLKDCEKVAYEYVRGGGHIPGIKLVESQGKREWYGLDYEIAANLMRLIGTTDQDLVFPRKLITITEAEKMVKEAFRAGAKRGKKKQAAEAATEAMALLTLKNAGKSLKLVPDSDKRPPANRAQIDFHQVVIPTEDETE